MPALQHSAGDQKRVRGTSEVGMFLRSLKSYAQTWSSLLTTLHRHEVRDSKDLPRDPARGVTDRGPVCLQQVPLESS